LRRIEEAFSDLPVTVLLFGSYARGEATALSDFDLLVIQSEDGPRPPQAPGLPAKASVFRVPRRRLRELSRESSIVLAALLEGLIIVDNLNLCDEIGRLRRELKEAGAAVTRSYVRFPLSLVSSPSS